MTDPDHARLQALLRECVYYLETTAAGLMPEVSQLLERVDAALGVALSAPKVTEEHDDPTRVAPGATIRSTGSTAEGPSGAVIAATPLSATLETCPHCHDGVNSREHGGTAQCFHCDRCGYVGCLWTDSEKRDMLAALSLRQEPRHAREPNIEAVEAHAHDAEGSRTPDRDTPQSGDFPGRAADSASTETSVAPPVRAPGLDLDAMSTLARTHRMPRDPFAEQLSAAIFRLVAAVRAGAVCGTHGDPLVCLACEADEDRVWRLQRHPPLAIDRLVAQTLAISELLTEAGIGPCSLPEGVRELLQRVDAQDAAAASLRQQIEALPRYFPPLMAAAQDFHTGQSSAGRYVKLADVRALLPTSRTLSGAPE